MISDEIVETVLGWKRSDVEFLENLLKRHNISFRELRDAVAIEDEDAKDINDYIYVALTMIEEQIEDKLVETANDLGLCIEDKIREYSPDIYVNYLDSGFTDPWFLLLEDEFNKKIAIEFFRRELKVDVELLEKA